MKVAAIATALVVQWVLAVPALGASAQVSHRASTPSSILVKAAKVLDVRRSAYLGNAGIWIEGERVKEVGPFAEVHAHAPAKSQVIDLGNATVLPGLIDSHTHLLAAFSHLPEGYIESLATESRAYRALIGAANARATLEAGFTTVRDIENEGSGYADVAVRDAIERGLIVGPRMQVATRAIAAVGQYYPFGVSPDLTNFPTGAQLVSGVEEARRAAREQIGHGADLIKIYADWVHPTLTVEELHVVVEEAHRQGHKVAAHATTPQGIKNAVLAGVNSIEHGHGADREALEMMKEHGVFLVPTAGMTDRRLALNMAPERSQNMKRNLAQIQRLVPLAKRIGVKIASGFDASERVFQGRNAEELMVLVKDGLTPAEAIRAATVNAAELMGWSDDVGAVEAGKYADLIAVQGDPLADISVLQHVAFVMKGGAVVKNALRD